MSKQTRGVTASYTSQEADPTQPAAEQCATPRVFRISDLLLRSFRLPALGFSWYPLLHEASGRCSSAHCGVAETCIYVNIRICQVYVCVIKIMID